MESGAILLYLADKAGKLLPPYGSAGYWTVMQWMMWQIAHFGPMLGQAHHFLHFKRGTSEYAEDRYRGEAKRLYRVLDQRLEGREYIADELTIADIIIWPWSTRFDWQEVDPRRLSECSTLVPGSCGPPGIPEGLRRAQLDI